MTGAPTETVQVPLDRLVMDPVLQIRGGTDQGTVNRYAKALAAGTNFPAITVVPVDPEDHKRGFILIDGWHRVEAIKQRSRDATRPPTVTAVVLSGEQDRRRWQWLAAQANQTHGLPLPYRRRREVFRAYVRAGEHWEGGRGGTIKSARGMSRDLAGLLSHPTVLKWMRSDFPSVYRAMNEAPETPDRDHEFFYKDSPDEANAKFAAENIEQLLATFRAIGAQEVRDGVLKRAEGALRVLKEEPPRDYSGTDAAWTYEDDDDADW